VSFLPVVGDAPLRHEISLGPVTGGGDGELLKTAATVDTHDE
jgi:hypothetical protein